MALTVLALLPLAGAVVVLVLVRAGRVEPARRLALGVSMWTLASTLAVWASFDPAADGFQLANHMLWLEPVGAAYALGVDGVSLALVTLTACLTALALLASWRVPPGLAAIVLVLESAAITAFSARDLLLFFVSSEVMVVAIWALVGVWGRERRVHAATKLLLSHLTGSGLMLLAILWIAWRHQVATGVWTFAVDDLVALDLPVGVQTWLWWAFAVAFAVRTPLVPLHTWLPDALAQAPPAAAVLLGGVVVNAGLYGLFRFAFPILPEATVSFVFWLAVPAAVGTVYGALAAMAQTDLRRVVAYLVISHMGVAVLGVTALTAQGVTGAVVQLLAGGLWSGGFLLVIGTLEARRQTTQIAQYGGLWRIVPGLSTMLLLTTAAAMALPGTIGFTGVVGSLTGTMASETIVVGRLLAIVAIVGVALWGVCLLRVCHTIIGGPVTRDRNRGLRDLTTGEWIVVAPVGALVVVLGVWSAPVLALVEPAAREVLVEVVGVAAAP